MNKFSNILKRGLITSAVIVTLGFLAPLILRNLSPMCQENSLVFPTIEKLSPLAVNFAGGKQILIGFGPIRVREGTRPVDVYLIGANGTSAKFYYRTIQTLQIENDIETTETIRCQYTVKSTDYQHFVRTPELLLQPSDFGNDWVVGEYLQFVWNSTDPQERIIDSVSARFSLTRQGNSNLTGPYDIRTYIRYFETDQDAQKAFEEYSNHNSQVSNQILLPSELAYTSCYDGGNLCVYWEQVDKEILYVSIFLPEGQELEMDILQQVYDLSAKKFKLRK